MTMSTSLLESMRKLMPRRVQSALDALGEAVAVFREIDDPRVMRSLGPSGVRGLLLKRGKQGVPSVMPASHGAFFDWGYPHDQPEMADLYTRAKRGQWDGDSLPWELDVDFDNPDIAMFPEGAFDWEFGRSVGMRLDARERMRLLIDLGTWAISQFLHGEQGALLASAQVTEAVQFMDGKFYGATQVVDEARHVEVFSRYLLEKAGKVYQINDNLFTIIDALMTDGRWDLKFLGMQIMVEG
ncbi:MAG: ferritin-like domain-containing protein, partial [Myxococcales bacterium]|nr:ferritin-like domain-containing protein [Myxococcales bacterium]